ncbi:retrotransposon protein, putative, ty1-copia subclass [Tanacetum coccineum]
MVYHGLNRCESLGRCHPGNWSLRIKQLTVHSAQTLIEYIYLLMTIDVMSRALVYQEIPLDKGLFEEIPDIRAIRILIAIAAYYDYEIWQMDVNTAFLNGYLNEEVYMEQPEGFINPKYPNRVCKLKRSIYGLKQASRPWNKRFDDEIKKFGFSQNVDEPCVYLKASGSNVTFLIVYVDDILIMGNSIPVMPRSKRVEVLQIWCDIKSIHNHNTSINSGSLK